MNVISTPIDQVPGDLRAKVTAGLDELQARLPAVPAAWLSLNRATARRVGSTMGAVAERVGHDFGRFGRDTQTAAATVRGQARSGATRVASTLEGATNETLGQARAQGTRVADEAVSTTTGLLSDAERAMDPAERRLDTMTKADLYDRAQELDIDGRSGMNKAQLVKAVAAAERR